jgi:hypothetical protein
MVREEMQLASRKPNCTVRNNWTMNRLMIRLCQIDLINCSVVMKFSMSYRSFYFSDL